VRIIGNVSKWNVAGALESEYRRYCGGQRESAAWRVYIVWCWYRSDFFFLQASCTPSCVPCIPEIYWFSRSCAIVPVILLPYVVPPPSTAQYAAAPTLAAPPSPCRPGISTTRIPPPAVPTYSDLQRPYRHSIRSHYKPY